MEKGKWEKDERVDSSFRSDLIFVLFFQRHDECMGASGACYRIKLRQTEHGCVRYGQAKLC